MTTISNHITLNPNFTPTLFEKILSGFVEECSNREHNELSQYIVELISHGLPDEDDKKELMALFSKIIAETRKINSTNTETFHVNVVLNDEYNFTLKFEKNFAPFMGGAWQRA